MLNVDFLTNRVFSSRTYILSKDGCDEVWLVDCGDADRIMEMAAGRTIRGVLLTHAHSDHIYGLEEIMKSFPKLEIYTNQAGVEALKSPQLNISRYHSKYPDISIDRPENIRLIGEGDEVEVLGTPVKVYETPGHAASCLTYIIDDKIFTGDAYIPGVKVFTGFPHSNRKQAQASVERILQLSKSCLVMPGHTLQEE
jgi:glyoxylase-like metal-dependent hydrolase (beta-lactamase superfamily II)